MHDIAERGRGLTRAQQYYLRLFFLTLMATFGQTLLALKNL